MDSEQRTKVHRLSEHYSSWDSAMWHDPMADTTPRGSSVTLLPLSKPDEVFSSFGEQDCGEPSKSQHIVIDFTPDPEIDNTESQKKCCALWDFIKKQPYVQHLFVYPTPPTPVTRSIISKVEVVDNIPPAVTVLERDTNDLIKLSFDAKMPKSKCTVGAGSYSEEDPTIRKKDSPNTPRPICTCSGICSSCKKSKKSKAVDAPSKIKTKNLCKIFNDWDKEHPKSMEPPGPVMQHLPVLQRKLPPVNNRKTCLD